MKIKKDPLMDLDDAQLLEAAVSAIQAAARGESLGGDELSYEHAMAVMAESDRRLLEAGHNRRCGAGIYSQAFEQVTAAHSGHPLRAARCTCAELSRPGGR